MTNRKQEILDKLSVGAQSIPTFKAMDEYAKAQSIAFAEWKDLYYVKDSVNGLFYMKQGYMMTEKVTWHGNESLYTLFLSHQSLTSKEK